MNYYMPYFNYNPGMAASITSNVSPGLFSRLFGKGFNLGNILNTAQKTLGVVNQAIPVIKQVTPVMKNAKTMFKVMNEFKRIDTPSINNNVNTNNNNYINNVNNDNKKDIIDNTQNITYDGGPIFFIN